MISFGHCAFCCCCCEAADSTGAFTIENRVLRMAPLALPSLSVILSLLLAGVLEEMMDQGRDERRPNNNSGHRETRNGTEHAETQPKLTRYWLRPAAAV